MKGRDELPLLRVKQVSKSFPLSLGDLGYKSWRLRLQPRFFALKDVSLDIYRGESVGLVGASGGGKTTLGKIILRLFPQIDYGEVLWSGNQRDVYQSSQRELRQYRRKVQMIFQNPDVALNPGMMVEQIIKEALKIGRTRAGQRKATEVGRALHTSQWFKERREISKQMREYLDIVNLNDRLRDYPDALSGGEKKRIGIIRAFAAYPDLIIADEPLVGLDVSLRNQLINLFLERQRNENLALLYISHDVNTVKHLCSKIAVILMGRIVEQGATSVVTENPKHPYTVGLLSGACYQDIATEVEASCKPAPTTGCIFQSRCFLYQLKLNPEEKFTCESFLPAFYPVSVLQESACHFWRKIT